MKKGVGAKIVLFICCMMLMIGICSAKAMAEDGQKIRVLLESSANMMLSMTVRSGTYTAINANGQVLASLGGDDLAVVNNNGGQYSLSINGLVMAEDQPIISIIADSPDSLFIYAGKTYRGDFKAVGSGIYFYAINVLGVEPYLYGVVGKEIGYNYAPEALKAQAIAARSYALSKIRPGNIYDVTNTVASQVYGGYSAEAASIIQAVDATYGQVVYYHGKVVEAVFHSNAGGFTENIENVWSNNDIPIIGVPSPYDSYASNFSSYGASTYAWTIEYTPARLVELANAYGNTNIGEFVDISLSTTYNGVTSVSGRAMVVTITGTAGSVTAVKDTNIRRLLGTKSSMITINDGGSGGGATAVAWMKDANGKLTAATGIEKLFGIRATGTAQAINGSNSSFYVASRSGVTKINKNGSSNVNGGTIVINGKGYGHGIGMSQW
ncbi:MAG: SpoIID/LytB domain-containing protein, partial [Clostridiales bacterium]